MRSQVHGARLPHPPTAHDQHSRQPIGYRTLYFSEDGIETPHVVDIVSDTSDIIWHFVEGLLLFHTEQPLVARIACFDGLNKGIEGELVG